MATVSQDGILRVWKLRQKSNAYSIVSTTQRVHQVDFMDIDSFYLRSSQSNEIKESEHIAKYPEEHNLSAKRKQKYKNSTDSLTDSYKEAPSTRKDLRFELCHEIKLMSTWIMCVDIHCEGNLIAIGGLDANVALLDISNCIQPKNRITSVPFEIDSKKLMMAELHTFWEEYVSCIQFLNDFQHILVGSGDGSVAMINYRTMQILYRWKCDAEVLSIDYLYLDIISNGHSVWNRTKSPTMYNTKKKHKKTSSSKWFSKSKSKKSKKTQQKIEETTVEFDGVPIVADFGDDSDSSSEDAAAKYGSNHRHLSDANWQNIQILIGTASTKQCNVFIDEYKLQMSDLNAVQSNKQMIAKQHKSQYAEKSIVNGIGMTFGICLNNAKCESVAFSPNGRYFAVGGQSAEYRIYERHSMQCIHRRYTKDEEDKMVLLRRPNMKRSIQEDEGYDFVTCLVWINEQSLAVGNGKGDFLYISTILDEYKVRNSILRECVSQSDREYNICSEASLSLDNIIDEIQEFIGCDVVDNVIETQFGDRTSCLAAHPYFEMKAVNQSQNNSANPSPRHRSSESIHKKQGLCVSGSWSAVFNGCVLKG